MNRSRIFAILIGALLVAVPVRGQGNVEAIVAQNVRPILPGDGKGGGVAVAVRINGETVSLITASLMNDAWQNVSTGNLRILDKNGGLNNTSTYIGFAPQRKLGVVIFVNRGKQHATGIGRQILHALA